MAFQAVLEAGGDDKAVLDAARAMDAITTEMKDKAGLAGVLARASPISSPKTTRASTRRCGSRRSRRSFATRQARSPRTNASSAAPGKTRRSSRSNDCWRRAARTPARGRPSPPRCAQGRDRETSRVAPASAPPRSAPSSAIAPPRSGLARLRHDLRSFARGAPAKLVPLPRARQGVGGARLPHSAPTRSSRRWRRGRDPRAPPGGSRLEARGPGRIARRLRARSPSSRTSEPAASPSERLSRPAISAWPRRTCSSRSPGATRGRRSSPVSSTRAAPRASASASVSPRPPRPPRSSRTSSATPSVRSISPRAGCRSPSTTPRIRSPPGSSGSTSTRPRPRIRPAPRRR